LNLRPERHPARRGPASGALHLFFHHFYHELAWTYDSVAALVSLGRWPAWILSVLPFVEGQRVLELAFGTGQLQKALLSRMAGLVVGVDESSQMARLARARLAQSGLLPAALIRGLAQKLPFPASSFDTVVSTFPSEFITLAPTLEEIRRILRPSGKVIVLPLAWIVGRGLLDRTAAAMFRITHQTPDASIDSAVEAARQTFAAHGFGMTWQQFDLRGSTVLVLIAVPYPPGTTNAAEATPRRAPREEA
jgi:SAM-dependent methyltransferase